MMTLYMYDTTIIPGGIHKMHWAFLFESCPLQLLIYTGTFNFWIQMPTRKEWQILMSDKCKQILILSFILSFLEFFWQSWTNYAIDSTLCLLNPMEKISRCEEYPTIDIIQWSRLPRSLVTQEEAVCLFGHLPGLARAPE